MSLTDCGGVRKSDCGAYGSIKDSEVPGPSVHTVSSLKGDDRIERLKGQVREVKDIMKDNLEKVIERGEKTGELNARTELLAVNSTRFKESSTDLRKQTQRRNWKLICCFVLVMVIILGIIAVIVLYALKVI